MIIRSLRLRQGRIALPKATCPRRAWHRALSSNVEKTENPFGTQGQDINSVSNAVSNGSGRKLELHDPSHPVARSLEFAQHQRAQISQLGGDKVDYYKPHQLLSNPPRPQDITLELLMASQAHLGHSTSLWNPSNAKYIFGIRGVDDPIHIISLDVTASYLRRACKIVRGVTEKGGLVLFVGTRNGQARTVVKAAEMAKGCHLFNKWTPGTITNGQQILGKCQKKVLDEHDVEVEGFEEQLVTKAAIKPDLVVCLNPLENYILLHECGLNNIPTIGVIDTDANPTWVTYPIPANDDSLRCIQVIAGVLGRAGQEGQEARLEKAKAGEVTYRQDHGLDRPTFDRRGVSGSAIDGADKLDDEFDVAEDEVAAEAMEIALGESQQTQTAQVTGTPSLASDEAEPDDAEVDALTELDSSLVRDEVASPSSEPGDESQAYTRDRGLN